MPTLLLTVRESFARRGGGVQTSPRVSLSSEVKGDFVVRLVAPGGSSQRDAQACFEVAHVRGALPPFALVIVHDVPPGTQIWTVD